MLQQKPPHTWLRFYAVPREDYSDEAAADFIEKTLPEMRKWLLAQLQKTETMRIGLDEDLLAEWDGAKHVIHAVKFVIN
jgi:hypothetical protein